MHPLFPIIDAALSDAAARSGDWLACRPGCHQCCVGVFVVTALDVATLREGLAAAEPAVAARIRERALASRLRLAADFPGDATSGRLFSEADHEELFEDFGNAEVCPVLDPVTGTCDLYTSRPVQCRTFGPPVRDDEGALTVCELCFVDAPAEEVARCEMEQSWRGAEEEAIQAAGGDALTIIAFALSGGAR
jgi:Fe-S-cluster containining protein